MNRPLIARTGILAVTILKVNSKSGDNARALVRFNLPQVPADCTETGVTWANQPTTTGGAATAPSRTSPGHVEWTVTSQVQAMYSGPTRAS
jgi:large repetitive protein